MNPFGVAVAGGEVFWPTPQSPWCVVFGTDGTFLRMWSFRAVDGQFRVPLCSWSSLPLGQVYALQMGWE